MLKEQDHHIVLAANQEIIDFAQNELGQVDAVLLRNPVVRYASSSKQGNKLMRQLPAFFISVAFERKKLRRIVREKNIDVIISDNRYGMWSSSCPSFIITHQTHIMLPYKNRFLQRIVNSIVYRFLSKFDEVWIPDMDSEFRLAGELSAFPIGLNARYIGLLSKLEKQDLLAQGDDYSLILLSGPEPQRSLLETIICRQVLHQSKRFVLVRGSEAPFSFEGKLANCEVYNFAHKNELSALIQRANIVIARSAYTSLMDLLYMNKKALLIPTPGQSEQEYLAAHLKKEGIYYSVEQSKLKLFEDIELALSFDQQSRKGLSFNLNFFTEALTKQQKAYWNKS